MTNITQFPIPALSISQITPVSSSQFTDILVADQTGVTGTESLQQIYNLFLPSMFLSYNGDPNGHVAGIAFQTCFDLNSQILYICTVTGNATSAVWRQCIASSNLITNNVVTGSAVMNSFQNYIANSSITTTLTLPSSSSYGDIIYVLGRQVGWTIAQRPNQQIFVSPAQTTVGITGSLSSLHPRDSIVLFCTTPNLEWQVQSQQSAGLDIV
jgi:hypothetical protein